MSLKRRKTATSALSLDSAEVRTVAGRIDDPMLFSWPDFLESTVCSVWWWLLVGILAFGLLYLIGRYEDEIYGFGIRFQHWAKKDKRHAP